MTEEMIMALGAFCVFFFMWVIIPTVVRNRKSQQERES